MTPPLPLGSTIGILGAGQLGKMLAEAATKLGYKTHIYAPDEDPIAAAVSTYFTPADYTDETALQKFASSVDVITLEFENVPVAPLKSLTTPIYPSPKILEISQHRVREKQFIQSLGIGTADFRPVNNQQEFAEAVHLVGTPGILKTCTMGYDGKGQWKVTGYEDGDLPAEALGKELIYEGFVKFSKEISVIVARNVEGDVQCFEPVENEHKNHILDTTTAPANILPKIRDKAIAIATKLAEKFELVGLLAVEMFVTTSNDVLVNEVAPRPHNSGHWTLDGANVSQFEQTIRAVTGMELVKPERLHEKVVMKNLISDEANTVSQWNNDSGARVHLYGKKEARPGRKMGHVTVVSKA